MIIFINFENVVNYEYKKWLNILEKKVGQTASCLTL